MMRLGVSQDTALAQLPIWLPKLRHFSVRIYLKCALTSAIEMSEWCRTDSTLGSLWTALAFVPINQPAHNLFQCIGIDHINEALHIPTRRPSEHTKRVCCDGFSGTLLVQSSLSSRQPSDRRSAIICAYARTPARSRFSVRELSTVA